MGLLGDEKSGVTYLCLSAVDEAKIEEMESISVDEVLIGYPSSIQSRYGMVALS